MPVRVWVDRAKGLIVLRLEGIVSADEIAREAAPLIEAPELSLLPLGLFDLTALTRFDGASEFIRHYAQRASRFIDGRITGPARTAIAASQDGIFGLARMYELHRGDSPVEFEVFRSLPEAERWLGLPGDYAERLVLLDPRG